MSERRGSLRLTWADAGILATVLIWGVNMPAVKATLAYIPPLAFTAMRFSIAAVLQVIMLYALGQTLAISWSDFKRMAGMSLAGVLSYQVLFILGIDRTTAGNSSVLLATVPVFVGLYNALFKHQRLGRLIWLGASLTFAGVLLLTLGRGHLLSVSLATFLGDALVLLAAVCWSLYTVSSQRLLERFSPLKITAYSTLLSAPMLDLLALPDFLSIHWAALPFAAWAGLAFSGFFGIAAAYLLWNISVKLLGDTRASIYSNLTPIISLAVAWVALGESLALLQLAGVALVLGGVALARFAPLLSRPRSAPDAEPA